MLPSLVPRPEQTIIQLDAPSNRRTWASVRVPGTGYVTAAQLYTGKFCLCINWERGYCDASHVSTHDPALLLCQACSSIVTSYVTTASYAPGNTIVNLAPLHALHSCHSLSIMISHSRWLAVSHGHYFNLCSTRSWDPHDCYCSDDTVQGCYDLTRVRTHTERTQRSLQ